MLWVPTLLQECVTLPYTLSLAQQQAGLTSLLSRSLVQT